MECQEFNTLIIERYDKKLSDDILLKMDKHLEECHTCQEEFIQTGKLLDIFTNSTDEAPASNVKTDFYAMLENEINKQSAKGSGEAIKTRKLPVYQIVAAAVILLCFGYFAGMLTVKHSLTRTEIAGLRHEIQKLQENSYVLSLHQPSSSERLKIVNTVGKEFSNNEQVLNALIHTLNTDISVNVRMAAAYALVPHADREQVRTAIIQSFENQSEPILQITLINILTGMQDKRAKPLMEELLNREDILPEVKEHAAIGLNVFI